MRRGDTEAPGTEALDDYLAECAPQARDVLEKIREIVRSEAPDIRETISYRMPAFMLDRIVLYCAAFRKHIGIYPPVRGSAALLKALAPYRGDKGNLKFPLDDRMPYALIRRVVRARLVEAGAKPRPSTTKSRRRAR